MSLNKTLIAQRFAKAGESYLQQAVVQQQMSQVLLKKMSLHLPSQFTQVLEIGCGTGNLTYPFLEQFDVKNMVLNDLYPSVQQHLSCIAVEHSWLIGDIETLPLPSSLDLIVSGAALQWMHDIAQLLQRCADALLPEGYLCFSTFGTDNLQEMKALTGYGLMYFSVQQWQLFLQQTGFEILDLTESHSCLYFETPKDILRHLKATGVTGIAQQHRWTKQLLKQFEQDYQQFHTEKGFCLTYHPMYCVARRVK